MELRPILQTAPGAQVVIDGRRCLYFAGTAYLGLQGDPRVVRAACDATERYGLGAATTRAGFGNQPPTVDVESAAAQYFGQPSACYYPSGYLGPAIVLSALGDTFDAAFVDEQSHYAIFDALRASARRFVRFRHRDPTDLRKKMHSDLRATERALVVSDGVFAASGRVAPVNDYLAALASFTGTSLFLDDAHGVGVLGEHGRGTLEHVGIPADQVNSFRTNRPGPRIYFCATLSKALGGYGGILPGDRSFIERARSASHVFDGSSAPPAAMGAGSAAALKILMDDAGPRRKLQDNVRRLRAGLLRIGLDVEDQPTPIVSLDLIDPQLMRHVQGRLMEQGIAIGYLTYAGTSERGALRIAVCATHTDEMIDHLITRLREAL
jgi:8-amino-7-oxononanoate synthase